MARDRWKKINVKRIRNIIASAKTITSVISQKSDLIWTKDSEQCRVIVTGLYSYQRPYFLSCRELCSHSDREVHLRNKQTFYSKQCSQDLAVLTFSHQDLNQVFHRRLAADLGACQRAVVCRRALGMYSPCEVSQNAKYFPKSGSRLFCGVFQETVTILT